MVQTFVLVTGGNRGLGQGLVKAFLARPNHVVIAANRAPDHPTSRALSELPKAAGSHLIVVKYDASIEQDAVELVTKLRDEHAVQHLDIVIANAAILQGLPLVKDVKRVDIAAHTNINVFGVLSLYQATRALLQNSPREPVFAPIGSNAGSIGAQLRIPSGLYGPTKAMLNWYAVRIADEDPWLKTIVLHPGLMDTEMGHDALRFFKGAGLTGLGVEDMVSVEDSVNGLVRVITTGKREEFGGKVVSYTGEILPW